MKEITVEELNNYLLDRITSIQNNIEVFSGKDEWQKNWINYNSRLLNIDTLNIFSISSSECQEKNNLLVQYLEQNINLYNIVALTGCAICTKINK